MLDGNPDSLARSFEANPLVVELSFPEPRRLEGLSIIIGSTEVQVTARLYASQDAQPVEYQRVLTGTVDEPKVFLEFSEPIEAKILYLEVNDLHQAEPGHVHVWEIFLH
jgi:hypothetical protein